MAKQAKAKPNPDLLTRLWRDIVLTGRLMVDRRVGGMLKLIPLAMVAYILSPLDLIPDIFVPLGIVDDISALVIGLQLFIHSAPPDVVAEYRGQIPRGTAQNKPKRDQPTIIEGEFDVRPAHDEHARHKRR